MTRVCCIDCLLFIVCASLVLLTVLQPDVLDVGFPSNDESSEQVVAKVGAYIE